MDHKITEEIISLYDDKLNLLENEFCSNCNPKIKYPLLPWHVGKDFFNNDYRILFVGKPHRGKPGQIVNKKYINPYGISKSLFMNKHKWAYWSYTKSIATNIFHSDRIAWNNIAITNIIKCTNTYSVEDPSDKTSLDMAKNCISKNSTIFEEINIIKPRIIIFYTWHLYRELLKNLPEPFNLIEEKTNIDNRVKCGNKNIGWWDRIYKVPWTSELKILVVSHPGRKKKDEYTNLILEWIKE